MGKQGGKLRKNALSDAFGLQLEIYDYKVCGIRRVGHQKKQNELQKLSRGISKATVLSYAHRNAAKLVK